MVARDLIRLLEAKHSDDVFVDECKDGPTHSGSHFRLDGWAMNRSWANPVVYGYEVKVSRGDFLQDQKWPAYLPMCNQLYFVCPTGLIQPHEMPAEVGLLWASKNGARLYMKAKAAHRDVEIPENVWRYILMCRSKVTREHVTGGADREFWEGWLAQKRIDRDFGNQVGGALQKRFREEIETVQAENKRLATMNEKYEDIRKFLESIGIKPEHEWRLNQWEVKCRLEQARSVIPDGLVPALGSLAREIERVQSELTKLDEEPLGGEGAARTRELKKARQA